MNNVYYMEEYRQQKWEQESSRWLPGGELPYVTDGSIWTKNYNNFDDLMTGLIKIKQLMEHHMPYTEEWKYFLLTLLDQSFFPQGRRTLSPGCRDSHPDAEICCRNAQRIEQKRSFNSAGHPGSDCEIRQNRQESTELNFGNKGSQGAYLQKKPPYGPDRTAVFFWEKMIPNQATASASADC